MALDFPYFVFIHLYDSKVDSNYITDRWVYITGEDTTVSGQTDSVSGQCAINIQDATSSNGDVLTISDNTYEYQFILDTSTPSVEFNNYQNATNVGDIFVANNNESKEISLHTDNYVKKDINLKTSDY